MLTYMNPHNNLDQCFFYFIFLSRSFGIIQARYRNTLLIRPSADHFQALLTESFVGVVLVSSQLVLIKQLDINVVKKNPFVNVFTLETKYSALAISQIK